MLATFLVHLSKLEPLMTSEKNEVPPLPLYHMALVQSYACTRAKESSF